MHSVIQVQTIWLKNILYNLCTKNHTKTKLISKMLKKTQMYVNLKTPKLVHSTSGYLHIFTLMVTFPIKNMQDKLF